MILRSVGEAERDELYKAVNVSRVPSAITTHILHDVEGEFEVAPRSDKSDNKLHDTTINDSLVLHDVEGEFEVTPTSGNNNDYKLHDESINESHVLRDVEGELEVAPTTGDNSDCKLHDETINESREKHEVSQNDLVEESFTMLSDVAELEEKSIVKKENNILDELDEIDNHSKVSKDDNSNCDSSCKDTSVCSSAMESEFSNLTEIEANLANPIATFVEAHKEAYDYVNYKSKKLWKSMFVQNPKSQKA